MDTVTQQEVAAMTLPHMLADERARLDLNFWVTDHLADYDDPAVCGTALCAAGWAGHLLGYSIDLHGTAVKRGEKDRHVSHIAQEALELTDEQAYWLFHVSSEDEAVRCFEEMADGLGFPQGLIPHAD